MEKHSTVKKLKLGWCCCCFKDNCSYQTAANSWQGLHNQHGTLPTLKLVQNVLAELCGFGLSSPYWCCWLVWSVTDAVTRPNKTDALQGEAMDSSTWWTLGANALQIFNVVHSINVENVFTNFSHIAGRIETALSFDRPLNTPKSHLDTHTSTIVVSSL